MKNQQMDIPSHIQQKWDTATGELGEASDFLNEAQEKHKKTILARIAFLSGHANSAVDCQTIDTELHESTEELQMAHKRYHQAIHTRGLLFAEMNQ